MRHVARLREHTRQTMKSPTSKARSSVVGMRSKHGREIRSGEEAAMVSAAGSRAPITRV